MKEKGNMKQRPKANTKDIIMSNGKVYRSTRGGLWKSQRETLERANSNMAEILEEAPKLNYTVF